VVVPRSAARSLATLRVWTFLLLLGGGLAARAAEPAGDTAAPPNPPGPADEAQRARVEKQVEQSMKEQREEARERERALRKRARLLPHYEYLEDSYLNYFLPRVGPVGDHPLAFEAQAATHLFLVNQWEKVEHITTPGAMASVWSWDVSFLLHLRMVQDHSAPVRPPSYIPSTHVQWFGLWKPASGKVHELETELGLTHHSNGQQQCSFVPADQQDNASPPVCLDPGTVQGSLRHNVNYRSGDFSTSYATVGLHYAFMTLGDDRHMTSRHSFGVVYQENFVAHHDGFLGNFPGAMNPSQAWMYGIHRAKLEAQGHWHVGQPWTDFAGVLSATFSYELMWNTRPPIPGSRTIAELSYTVDGLHGLGIFIRGYTGQDNMNILYAAGRTNMVAAGLIWNTSPAVRYLFGEGEIPGE
jgi:hypothetical protein